MSEKENEPRMLWSCSLCQLPEEDEAERLFLRLQEADVSFWEDAVTLRRYIELTGLSQAACARAIGRSQAAVANRLRVLKLSPTLIEKMKSAALTERHARALLRLESDTDRDSALNVILRSGLNVAQTEAYVDGLLREDETTSGVSEHFLPLLKELKKLRDALPDISFEVRETEKDICLLVQISKKYDV